MPSKVDLVIKNGRMLRQGELVEGGLAVEDGVIVAITKEPNLPSADTVYDAGGNLILPGFIDLHVHFRDPGYPDREDFQTGTATAAAGGYTCIGDMPNPLPPTTTTEAYREKHEIARKRAIVDYALHGGVGEGTIDNIGPLSEHGARAFKTYTTAKYEALSASSPDAVRRILKATRDHGCLFMIHAEDQTIVDLKTKQAKEKGLMGFTAHAKSRPPAAEEVTIKMALDSAESTKSSIYVCHVSSALGVEEVRRAINRGVRVIAETCPHYLLLTEEDGVRLGPYAKTNPPLRSPGDRDALWRGLLDGTLGVVSSDHCPYTRREKDAGLDDIFEAPPGMPGLETSLPLMLTEMNEGNITLKRLVKACSENPAKALGIHPRKGALEVGSEADITVVDPKKKGIIRGDDLYTRSKITMFEGRETRGMPVATFVRGTLVMEDGKVVGRPGHGRFV